MATGDGLKEQAKGLASASEHSTSVNRSARRLLLFGAVRLAKICWNPARRHCVTYWVCRVRTALFRKWTPRASRSTLLAPRPGWIIKL